MDLMRVTQLHLKLSSRIRVAECLLLIIIQLELAAIKVSLVKTEDLWEATKEKEDYSVLEKITN